MVYCREQHKSVLQAPSLRVKWELYPSLCYQGTLGKHHQATEMTATDVFYVLKKGMN